MIECLLCLQADQEINKSIQFNSIEWIENKISSLIERHLWPMDCIKENAVICFLCWQQIKDFHKFYKRIEEVHGNYKILLTEDNKSKDLQLSILLEPEIIIGQQLEEAIVIKEEKKETIDSSDDKNIEETYSNDCNLNQESDSDDDDLPLIHRIKGKSLGVENKDNDFELRQNDDDNVSDDSNTDSDPLQPNYVGKRKRKSQGNNSQSEGESMNLKRKSYYTPRTNRLEQDKFLREHFKITCNKCNQTFDTFPLLCKHYSKEHNERGFVTCCGTKYFDRRLLVHHIKYHLDPEYFKCRECSRVLNTYSGLQWHMETHKERRFECDKCGKKFIEKLKWENHKTVHLPQEEKKHPCEVCGKLFGSESILITHQRVVHQGIYAKVCELCGVTMPDTSSFKNHMKKHEDNSFHVSCKECGLIVAGPIQLKRHCDIRHPADGKREYKCHVCPKVSPSLRALKKHIRCAHEMGYDFKCTICEKAFKRADNLKSHMFTHSGTHRYRCQWCPKTFNSDGNMYNHRKKAHPEEWLEAKRQKYSGNLPPDTIFPEALNLKQAK